MSVVGQFCCNDAVTKSSLVAGLNLAVTESSSMKIGNLTTRLYLAGTSTRTSSCKEKRSTYRT